MVNQEDLFAELHSLRRSVAKLLPEIPPHSEDWRPQDNMRSAWELANHLVQIPAIDVLICREEPQEVVRARESSLQASTVEGLLAVWDLGLAEAVAHFGSLSPAEFDSLETTAFYGHKMAAKAWLLEIVTHTHHHRAQLFTYLKLKGRPVHMGHLYA